jgi:hypothetical protein
VFSIQPSPPEAESLYAAIGRFAVKFAHVCHAMGSVITAILEKNGLRNYKLALAVLAGLSAESLRRNFEAVLAEVISSEPTEQAITSDILKRIGRLNERRNSVIHRTWFIGWTDVDDPDFSRAQGIRFRKDKHGAGPDFLHYSVAEFDELSTEADELTELVRQLGNAIISSLELSTRFDIEGDGRVRVRP